MLCRRVTGRFGSYNIRNNLNIQIEQLVICINFQKYLRLHRYFCNISLCKYQLIFVTKIVFKVTNCVINCSDLLFLTATADNWFKIPRKNLYIFDATLLVNMVFHF